MIIDVICKNTASLRKDSERLQWRSIIPESYDLPQRHSKELEFRFVLEYCEWSMSYPTKDRI